MVDKNVCVALKQNIEQTSVLVDQLKTAIETGKPTKTNQNILLREVRSLERKNKFYETNCK